MTTTSKPGLRIGILAHEFLINIGANDLLKNLLRGLAADPSHQIVFLVPLPKVTIEQRTSPALKERLVRIPFARTLLRRGARLLDPIAHRVAKPVAGAYAFYAEACPAMTIVPCEQSPEALGRVAQEQALDILMPSIHRLPDHLRYVTYWPDCQPKHYPEFFDDESQRVRDERIHSLLGSGRPMIIASRDAKGDMQRFYGAKPEQIFELPFAPIVEFEKFVPRPELMARFGLKRRYVIVCNQFWIHKSLETALEAAALAKARGLDLDFVFTGRMEEPRKPGYIDGLRRMVVDLRIQDTVKLLGYIAKDEQIELIKHAVAVVQPTLFEGGPGGGSVYDATSLGVRSIVSDIPINHELPLESGRITLFKTRDARNLLAKIEQVLGAPYRSPPPEDLYQQSRRATEALSRRLYEAIAFARAMPVATPADTPAPASAP